MKSWFPSALSESGDQDVLGMEQLNHPDERRGHLKRFLEKSLRAPN